MPRWAFYGPAAAEVMLDVIARSDGTRESVARALGRTRNVDTPLGPISLNALGEPIARPVAVLRVQRRAAAVEPGGMQGAVVTDLISPPARLVGGSSQAAGN